MNKTEREATTLATLSNAVTIGTSIVSKISGNEVSNQIQGQAMHARALDDLIATKIQSRLIGYLPR